MGEKDNQIEYWKHEHQSAVHLLTKCTYDRDYWKARAERAEEENASRELSSFEEHSDLHYWRDEARKYKAQAEMLERELKGDCGVCTKEGCKLPCACINGSAWQLDQKRLERKEE